MPVSRARVLAPPEGLRPAQVGIVLVGRVVPGHVSATLADLAQRRFLGIDEVDGAAGADWVLTDLRAQTAARPLGFEATLLDGLFGREQVVRLSSAGPELAPALSRFRARLGRDAVRRGWLRRWRRGQRTPRGEQLLREIHGFRWELRALAAAGDAQSLSGFAPYAMVFGLLPAVVSMADTPSASAAADAGTAVAWSQADRFVQSWLGVCAGLDWSAPHDHHSPSDNFGHPGYGSGYDGHGGGHHGGVGGGHSGY